MLSPEEKMEAAKKWNKALQEYEQVSIDYCVLQTIEKTIALSNSKGLSLCHKKMVLLLIYLQSLAKWRCQNCFRGLDK